MSESHENESTRLDLSTESVLNFFVKDNGKDTAREVGFILSLDSQDTWSVDFDDSKEGLKYKSDLDNFLTRLSATVDEHVDVLDEVISRLLKILAGVKTSRCMYILGFIDNKNPRFVKALSALLVADTSDDVMIATVKRRVFAFENAKLLGRIFSGTRLALITQIMGSYANA